MRRRIVVAVVLLLTLVSAMLFLMIRASFPLLTIELLEPEVPSHAPSTPLPSHRQSSRLTGTENPSNRFTSKAPSSFELALAESDSLYSPEFGKWWAADPMQHCNPCKEDCLASATRQDGEEWKIHQNGSQRQFKDWADGELRKLQKEMFSPWNASRRAASGKNNHTSSRSRGPSSGGITLDHHVNMLSCSYRTRTHHNPSGVWIHLYNRTVTPLRQMVDGYGRYKNILKYIQVAVNESTREFVPGLVFYVSVTDTPCNPLLPYFTFFGKRGVRGILIPDDTHTRSVHGGGWRHDREKILNQTRGIPYQSKSNDIFFRGSPTHADRVSLSEDLNEVTIYNDSALPPSDEAMSLSRLKERSKKSKFVNVSLAVMERFKHLSVPISEHGLHRYVLSIRGRTASSRDKYLLLLNSTIVKLDYETEPWFQWYHILWKPYKNYIPIFLGKQAKCLVKLLQKEQETTGGPSERIASNARRLGIYLTDEVASEFLLDALQIYAKLQTYTVPEDPIMFLRQFRKFVKKWYRSAQVMPDDRHPVKFHLEAWLSRRMKQMFSCKNNNTYNGVPLKYNSPFKCWY